MIPGPTLNLGAPCHRRGGILLLTLVFGAIGVLLMGGLVSWAVSNLKLSNVRYQSEVAFQIAEAGVNYYRWHLAHAATDFKDGTGQPGPYVHTFLDKDGVTLGSFSLTLDPPPTGSTVVTITATGTAQSNPKHHRTVRAKLAIPSLASYAVGANADMRFGAGTTVYGPIHSNGGIRFDAVAYNTVTSAKSTYTDPDHGGQPEFGVHTHLSPTDPLPPSAVPSRPDVFVAGRQFPVPAIDFAGLSANLAQLKTDAQGSGRYLASAGAQGYRVVLKTNDTFDLYRVNSLRSTSGNCRNWLGQSGWSSWSINTTSSAQTFLANYAFPGNGILFIEDNVWVEGQMQTARLTIASARFPENPTTNTSITVNTNVRYTTYDGQEALALITQNNINVGLYSDNVLQIDGALVAKNGRVGRYYYASQCGTTYIRSTITLNGMLATNQRYGFAYTDGTGYQTRNLNYDANLLYGPPPSFPLTSNQYVLISWEEVH